ILIIFCISGNACARNNNIYRNSVEYLSATDIQVDKFEIQNLILNVLSWSESNQSINLLPVITDSRGIVYIGFDLRMVEVNIEKLKETNFFTKEFIENYRHIILTLDRKIRHNKTNEWLVGDLPTFKFANGVNPWCLCQGYSPNDFKEIALTRINGNSCELIWRWKNNSSWNDFTVRVRKIDNRWKIDYMEGFDYKNSIEQFKK
ncbi:MAG TPA: hypothetical protein VFM18_09060, partial [Methanosarcina sp.]|nr:hypothetical protein [Methanosarcina sp.]